jgi:hypothetical protein
MGSDEDQPIQCRTSLWPLKSSRRTGTVDLETFFIFQPIFGFFVSGSSGGGSGL